MKQGILGKFLLAAALVASVAVASEKGKSSAPLTGADLEKSIRHEILMYPKYTLWDDIGFRIENGNVELVGAVSQPYKKSDIERIVGHVPGVASVTNEIKVLPLSPRDDRLRLQIARAIFSDPALARYAMGAVPAIHIIVDNGKVTLTGAVNKALEKQIAGMRASSAGLSFGPVTNNLTVDNPPAKKS
ncbi:MAG: BON domain-containing protein [Candidatus Solibacter sp.]|jgi:hyperosmotically inducible protein